MGPKYLYQIYRRVAVIENIFIGTHQHHYLFPYIKIKETTQQKMWKIALLQLAASRWSLNPSKWVIVIHASHKPQTTLSWRIQVNPTPFCSFLKNISSILFAFQYVSFYVESRANPLPPFTAPHPVDISTVPGC